MFDRRSLDAHQQVVKMTSDLRLCESEFKPNRSTRRRVNVRESSTGAEAGTLPKDGENIRSSELSEDLVEETRRKWPPEKSTLPDRKALRLLRLDIFPRFSL